MQKYTKIFNLFIIVYFTFILEAEAKNASAVRPVSEIFGRLQIIELHYGIQ